MAIHDIRKERAESSAGEQPASLRTLFSDLADETMALFRQEVALVRAETTEAMTNARSGIVWMAVGGVLALAAIVILLMAAVYGLSELMHPGWAALIVGVVAIVLGLIALGVGRSQLKASSMMPSRSMESLRRDANMVARRAP